MDIEPARGEQPFLGNRPPSLLLQATGGQGQQSFPLQLVFVPAHSNLGPDPVNGH